MYQKERKQQILYLLQEKNEMTVSELSRLLFTSESSIRRDLQAMELSGLVKRTHGGVKLLGDNPTIVPFASRLHYKVAEKKKMAKKRCPIFRMDRSFFSTSPPVRSFSPMSW